MAKHPRTLPHEILPEDSDGANDNLDTGLGDETPKVPVPAESNKPARNTPPAGEWNDVVPERPPAR